MCVVHKYGVVWEIEAAQCPLKEAETVEPTIGLYYLIPLYSLFPSIRRSSFYFVALSALTTTPVNPTTRTTTLLAGI